MRYERRPWLATVPWSQVMIAAPWYVWTVLPHWPPYQKRIICRETGSIPFLFTPQPTDMVTVLEPDEPEALANLAAAFGMPELLAWHGPGDAWWTCPPAVAATVLAHLRDWHGTLDQGSPSARLTHHSDAEALAYHWQLHQQQLVFPLPVGHAHT